MEGSMAGKFELYKDAKGKFRFRHQAGTGEIIAVVTQSTFPLERSGYGD